MYLNFIFILLIVILDFATAIAIIAKMLMASVSLKKDMVKMGRKIRFLDGRRIKKDGKYFLWNSENVIPYTPQEKEGTVAEDYNSLNLNERINFLVSLNESRNRDKIKLVLKSSRKIIRIYIISLLFLLSLIIIVDKSLFEIYLLITVFLIWLFFEFLLFKMLVKEVSSIDIRAKINGINHKAVGELKKKFPGTKFQKLSKNVILIKFFGNKDEILQEISKVLEELNKYGMERFY